MIYDLAQRGVRKLLLEEHPAPEIRPVAPKAIAGFIELQRSRFQC
jgi:hypothetical protein